MFELLPGTGLVLPRQVGVLSFGMSERDAQWAVASLADVRESWACGAGWAFTAAWDGLELSAFGDCEDRQGRSELDRNGLASVALHRWPETLTGPSAVPVVLDGVDVFGYPAAEVLDALAPAGHPSVWLPPVSSGSYLREVWVRCPPIDRPAPTRA
ncbi:hypothetical protein ACEZDB_21725 [Streptacidiphilus sp. N1-3]|uniref:Uncharacterized protein n=1 Tax=Streptacidiphilus alkalitolerans TaxID=3342712 RepID=A0ABV6X4Y6_9ACTN